MKTYDQMFQEAQDLWKRKKEKAAQDANTRLQGTPAGGLASLPRNNNVQSAPSQQVKTTVQQPQTKWWSGGEYPSAREVLAQITKIGQTDKERAETALSQFYQYQQDVTSPYYNPYVGATNQKALQNLSSILGQDLTRGVTKDWFVQNKHLLSGARLTTTGETPAAPTKTSTPAQDAAYWFYMLLKDEDLTDRAEREWKDLQGDIEKLANDPRLFSDEEILSKIDWSKYKTLASLDEAKSLGVPVGLNRPVGYSQDGLYGALWAARNPGKSSGNPMVDSAWYALGVGNKFVLTPEMKAARIKGTDDYHPYLTPTVYVDSSWDWSDTSWQKDLVNGDNGLPKNPGANATPAQQDAWERYQAQKPSEDTAKAKDELAKLQADVDSWIQRGDSADTIMKRIAWRLEDSDSVLGKMEDYRKRGGYLLLTEAVDFTLPRFTAQVQEKVAARDNARAELEAAEKQASLESLARGDSGFSMQALDAQKEIARQGSGDAAANNLEVDLRRGVKDILSGRETTDDNAQKWFSMYGQLLDREARFDLGGVVSHTDMRKMGRLKLGPITLAALDETGTEYTTADERIDQALQISRDYETAEASGLTIDEYYQQNPDALAQITGYAKIAQEREAQETERLRAERDALIQERDQLLSEALMATRVGTASPEQESISRQFYEMNMDAVRKNDEQYQLLLGEAGLRAQRIPESRLEGGEFAISLMAMRPFDNDLRYANALGVSLSEYYELYPERTITMDESFEAAQNEFRQIWTEFGAQMNGAYAAYEEILRRYPDLEKVGDDAPKEPTAIGEGVGYLTATGKGAEIGWNQHLNSWLGNVKFYVTDQEKKDIAAFMRGVYTRPEYRQAVEESIAAITDSEAQKYWVDQLAALDAEGGDIYTIGYNLPSEAIAEKMREKQANIETAQTYLYENGTEGEVFWANLTAAGVDNGLAMLQTTALTALGGGGMAANVVATTTAFGLREGAELGNELVEGGTSLGAARWWGIAAAALTGVMESLTNVNFMPEGLGGNAPWSVHNLVKRGGAKLFGENPGTIAKLLGWGIDSAVKLTVGAAEEFAQEGTQSLVMQEFISLAKGEGLIMPDVGQALEEAKMGALVSLFLYGQGAAIGSVMNTVSKGIGNRITREGGGLTVQDGIDLLNAARQDAQNPKVVQANEQLAAESQKSEIVVQQIEAGAMAEAVLGPEAKAVEAASVKVKEAEAGYRETQEAYKKALQEVERTRRAFQQNPADTQLLNQYKASKAAVAKTVEQINAASRARNQARTEYNAAKEALTQLQAATLDQLRVNAAQQISQEQNTRTAQSAQQVKAQEGLSFYKGSAETAPVQGEARTSAPLRNPIEITAQVAHDIGIGDATRSKRFSAGKMALPKKIQGYYAKNQRYINARNASDYMTTMHEIGHAVQAKTQLTATEQMVSNLDPAFRESYKPEELPGEAFAEFVRRYMTSAQDAVSFAGEEFVREFELALKKAKMYDAIRRAADDLRAYVNASAADRIASRIVDMSERSPVEGGVVEKAQSKLRKIATGTLDWTRPAEDVNLAVKRETGQYPTGRNNLRDVALRRNYDEKVAGGIMTNALVDPESNRIGDSLQQVFKGVKGKDFDVLNEYMLLKHSLDRDAQNKTVFGSEFNAEQRQARIAEIEREHPEIQAAQQRYVAWWQQFMQAWMVDTGFLSQENWDAMKAMYPNYVPTYRQVAEGGRVGPGTGSGFKIRAAKGSDLNVIAPIDSLIGQIKSIVSTVNKNKVGVTFHELYSDIEGMGWFGEQIPADMMRDDVSLAGAQERARQAIEDYGGDDAELVERVLGAIGASETQWTNTGASTERNTVAVVLPSGERVFYRMNDLQLYEMLTYTTPESMNGILKIIGKVTRGMSALTTGSNPIFALSNFIRDLRKSVYYGSWASNYLTGAIKWLGAAKDVAFERGDFSDYKALGGGGWTRMDARTAKSSAAYRRELFKGYQWSSPAEATKTIGRKIWGSVTLSRLNDIVETTSRYAEYKYGKQDKSTTEGRQQAFRAAQEVTVDFSRRGSSALASDLAKLVPFFNANVQGTYQAGRMFTTAERGMLGKRLLKAAVNAGIASALSQLLRNAYLDDEDKDAYTLLPTDIRNGYIILPNPYESDRRFLRFPVGNDPVDRFFHGVFTAILDAGEKTELSDELLQLGGFLLEGMNPVSSTIIDPMLATATNRNWYGGKIESDWLQELPVTQRYNESTPDVFVDTSRSIGGALGLSPVKLQYMTEQYSGFIGQMGMPAVSKNRYTGEIGGAAAVFKAIANRFTIDPSTTNDITDAYDEMYTMLNQVQREFKARDYSDILMPELTEQETMDAYNAAKALTGSEGEFGIAKDRISELWSQIEEVQTNQSLTTAQKNTLTQDYRMEMVREMQTAIAAGLEFEDAYVGKRSFLETVFRPKTSITMPTALDNMDAIFKADLESGEPYMRYAEEVFAATGKDSAVPHPNKGFSDKGVQYVIPEEYWDEWATEYKEAYMKHLDKNTGEWEEITTDERLEIMTDAHTAGHAQAKKWWLKYHREDGKIE